MTSQLTAKILEATGPLSSLSFDEINGREKYRGFHFYTKSQLLAERKIWAQVVELLIEQRDFASEVVVGNNWVRQDDADRQTESDNAATLSLVEGLK